ALAEPGRSCLLESVEGTERISRFSLIGLDYLETQTFNDDPNMLDGIRRALRKYRVEAESPFPGAAVCVFTYDAARMLERIGPKPPADAGFSDALVLVPGTWVVFDHFTHKTTLMGLARSAEERDAIGVRLEAYVQKLLAER